MSKTVFDYVMRVWAIWTSKASIDVWFTAWRNMVNICCLYTKAGWSDDDIIRSIRYTAEDAAIAAANNDPADMFFTEV